MTNPSNNSHNIITQNEWLNQTLNPSGEISDGKIEESIMIPIEKKANAKNCQDF